MSDYSFTIKVVDLATGELKQVAGSAQQITKQISDLAAANRRGAAAARTNVQALEQIEAKGRTLATTMDRTKRAMRLVDPNDARNLDRYNKLLAAQEAEMRKLEKQHGTLAKKVPDANRVLFGGQAPRRSNAQALQDLDQQARRLTGSMDRTRRSMRLVDPADTRNLERYNKLLAAQQEALQKNRSQAGRLLERTRAGALDEAPRSRSNVQVLQELDSKAKQLQNTLERTRRAAARVRVGDPGAQRNLERYNRLLAQQEAELKRIGKQADTLRNKMPGGGKPGGMFGMFKGVGTPGGFGQAFIEGASGGLPFGGATMLANPYALGGAALAGTLAYSAKRGLDFERAMGTVNATARLDDTGREQLKNEIRMVAMQRGVNDVEVANAFEQVLSTTNDLAKAREMLPMVLTGTKALNADAGTVGSALAYLGNIRPGSTAKDNLDLLSVARREGAGEAADFARYLPGLISMGRGNNMSDEESAALFSVLTRSGDAELANTLSQNLMQAMAKKDTREALDAAIPGGIYDANDKQKPMLEILKVIAGTYNTGTDREQTAIREQLELTDAQARQAFGKLIENTGQLDEVKRALEQRNGDALAAAEASANAATKWDEAWNKWGNVLSLLGDKIVNSSVMKATAEAVGGTADLLGVMAQTNNAGFNSGKVGNFDQFDLDEIKGKREWAEARARAIAEGRVDTPIFPMRLNSPSDSTEQMKMQAAAAVKKVSNAVEKGPEVSGIVIRIDKMVGVENQQVGGTKEAGKMAGNEVLRLLNKAIKDAEGMRGGGSR